MPAVEAGYEVDVASPKVPVTTPRLKYAPGGSKRSKLGLKLFNLANIRKLSQVMTSPVESYSLWPDVILRIWESLKSVTLRGFCRLLRIFSDDGADAPKETSFNLV